MCASAGGGPTARRGRGHRVVPPRSPHPLRRRRHERRDGPVERQRVDLHRLCYRSVAVDRRLAGRRAHVGDVRGADQSAVGRRPATVVRRCGRRVRRLDDGAARRRAAAFREEVLSRQLRRRRRIATRSVRRRTGARVAGGVDDGGGDARDLHAALSSALDQRHGG